MGLTATERDGIPSELKIALEPYTDGGSVTRFNDLAPSFESVKQMFEKAIAKLEAQEQNA
jgi:hypothetical protein